jgi:twitching motility protein PilT
MELTKLLEYALYHDCSDIHLTVGDYPYYRLNGKLTRIDDGEFSVLERRHMMDYINLMFKVTNVESVFNDTGDKDGSFELPNGKRFRVNAFKQRGNYSLAIRLVKSEPPTLDSLNLPDVVKELLEFKQGLILVTGPTGSGKTTTLAAMVDYLNTSSYYHIITLEDPIEFVHKNRMSLINQREIGSDSISYSNGLTAALRQDPDVVLLGEMRSNESISTALKAAETGHLVLSTLHTNDAPSTIDRIIDSFSEGQQDQIRVQLAESLVAVISQRLVNRIDGKGRVAALEIMINNHAIKNLIRKSKTFQIKNSMETNRSSGMITMEKSLDELRKSGIIADEQ